MNKWKWYEVQVKAEYGCQKWVSCLNGSLAKKAERFETKSDAKFFIKQRLRNPYETREFRIIKVRRNVCG